MQLCPELCALVRNPCDPPSCPKGRILQSRATSDKLEKLDSTKSEVDVRVLPQSSSEFMKIAVSARGGDLHFRFDQERAAIGSNIR